MHEAIDLCTYRALATSEQLCVELVANAKIYAVNAQVLMYVMYTIHTMGVSVQLKHRKVRTLV